MSAKSPFPAEEQGPRIALPSQKCFTLGQLPRVDRALSFSQKCSLMWLCIHCCQIPSLSWTKILAFCWKYDVHFNCMFSTLKLPLAKTHTLLRLLNPFLIPMDPSLLQVRFCRNTWVRQWLYYTTIAWNLLAFHYKSDFWQIYDQTVEINCYRKCAI